jgi:hypothetical protein
MPFPSIETSTFVADLIAALGLIGLAINAVLLHRQVKATNDQVEGMSRPAIVFLPPNSPEIRQHLKPAPVAEFGYIHLLNIGSGPALRITVQVPNVPSVTDEFRYLRPGSIEPLRTVRQQDAPIIEVTYYSLGNVRYRAQATWLHDELEQKAIERLD